VHALRTLVVLLVALTTTLLWTGDAHAYAWMIRHGYTTCMPCHSDPSGSGLLTDYGRALGDQELRMRYGAEREDPPPGSAGFLWGAIKPPEWLLLGGGIRPLVVASKAAGGATQTDTILMQADVGAEVRVGGFRANASVGAVNITGNGAAIAGPVVSREHWAGYAFGDDRFLVRGGRITLPYGLRSIEHTLYVRSETRTDINDTQQHGVAFAYSGDTFRGEIMGILGNYQINPDDLRQRGYSAYLEAKVEDHTAIGVSSLVTHANRDLYLRVEDWRQAHGVFARTAPWKPLVVMAEADLVMHAPTGSAGMNGVAAMLQGDLEPVQGLHVIATGELKNPGGASPKTSVGGWFGVDWFFLPHSDLRADVMYRKEAFGPTVLDVTAIMVQAHVYF
jgi:hypothetical protein